MFVRMSLKVVDDDLIGWLSQIGFWNENVAKRVEEAKGLLPMDVELNLKDFLKGKLNKFCLLVLRFIQSDSRGVTIESFELDNINRLEFEQEIESLLESGVCACEALIEMGLVRIDRGVKQVFKPLKISFDHRVIDLIGLALVY